MANEMMTQRADHALEKQKANINSRSCGLETWETHMCYNAVGVFQDRLQGPIARPGLFYGSSFSFLVNGLNEP